MSRPMRNILWAEIAGLPLAAIFVFGCLFLSISRIGGIFAPADVRNVSLGSVMLLAGIACAAVVIGFWVWLAPSSKNKPATLTRQ